MASPMATRKAYLLKEGKKRLRFVGNPPSTNSDRVLLFTADVENFICIPGETYDTDQIKLIVREMEKATEIGATKPKIEMYGKFDTFFQTPRIYTVVSFPQEFVKAFSGILPEPRICIKGTYMMLKHELREWSPSPSPPPYCPSVPNWSPRNLARGDCEPVDYQEFDFKVEGLELKENATYEGFKGLEKISEYYNSQGLRNVKLNYSIILEWKEYGNLKEGFEASTLEKLFEGKPLADCVIEASKGARFRCHRNILGVNSDVLLTMFEVGMIESQTRVIDMKDVNGEAVEMMLEYMYGRNLGLEGRSEEDILELLKLAHKYNISKLESAISQFLLHKPNDWFSMDGVLDLYLFVKNVDDLANLADKVKGVMKANAKELSTSTTFLEWMEKDAKAAAKFVLELLEPDERNSNVEVEDGSSDLSHNFVYDFDVDDSSEDE